MLEQLLRLLSSCPLNTALASNVLRCLVSAGVAFSKNSSSATDNIGYIIPKQVVDHFLDEYRGNGTFRGVPSAGFNTQTLENIYMRRYLRVRVADARRLRIARACCGQLAVIE